MKSITIPYSAMQCIHCGSELEKSETGVRCVSGGHIFTMVNSALNCTAAHDVLPDVPTTLIGRLKYGIKKFSTLYNTFAYIFGGQLTHLTSKKFVARQDRGRVILNLGSGTKFLRDDVINIDFYPFPAVAILADATQLPFKSNSVDAVVCDSLLEHVPDPRAVVQEIERIIKPGGFVYVVTPYLLPFHSAPYDYYRWSAEGLRQLLHAFEEQEVNVACGPSSAFVAMLGEWLAQLLSFNSATLYHFFLLFFMFLLSPIKLLDLVLANYATATNGAFSLYYLGKKK